MQIKGVYSYKVLNEWLRLVTYFLDSHCTQLSPGHHNFSINILHPDSIEEEAHGEHSKLGALRELLCQPLSHILQLRDPPGTLRQCCASEFWGSPGETAEHKSNAQFTCAKTRGPSPWVPPNPYVTDEGIELKKSQALAPVQPGIVKWQPSNPGLPSVGSFYYRDGHWLSSKQIMENA